MLFVDGGNWYHSLRKLGLTDLGRLEPRSVKNAAAAELKQYLNQLPIQVDRSVYRDLMDLPIATPRPG